MPGINNYQMDQNNFSQTIKDFKKTADDILFTANPINEYNFHYEDVNYTSFILKPFLEEISSTIKDKFPVSKYPIIIDSFKDWIDLISIKIDSIDNPTRYSPKKQHQYSHWKYFRKSLRDLSKSFSKEHDDYFLSSDETNPNLSLNRKEISLLIMYLQDFKVINPIVKNNKVSDCFDTLTHYKAEQIRKDLSHRAYKHLLTSNKTNYDKLKETLGNIINKIDEDLSNIS